MIADLTVIGIGAAIILIALVGRFALHRESMGWCAALGVVLIIGGGLFALADTLPSGVAIAQVETTYRVGDLTCSTVAKRLPDGLYECVWVNRSGHHEEGRLVVTDHGKNTKLYEESRLTEMEPVSR